MKRLNQMTKREFWEHIKKGSVKDSYAYDIACKVLETEIDTEE